MPLISGQIGFLVPITTHVQPMERLRMTFANQSIWLRTIFRLQNIRQVKPYFLLVYCVPLVFLLNGCDMTPYEAPYRTTAATNTTPLPPTKVFFYPNQGQSEQQQDRDLYECYLWAVDKSGYDPAQAQLAPHQKIEVVPEPRPGEQTTAGAVAGAIAGTVLSDPGHRDEGLVLGAITGAVIGAAAESAQAESAQRTQQQLNAQRYAVLEQQARDYRRAITACLEGRNYTVR